MKKPPQVKANPLAKMVGVKAAPKAASHPHKNLGKYLHQSKKGGC